MAAEVSFSRNIESSIAGIPSLVGGDRISLGGSPFRLWLAATAMLLLSTSAAWAGVVASWSNSSLNNTGTVSANVGTATIGRGSSVSRVSDTNHFTTTDWTSSEQSAPNFGNNYIEIRFASTGHTGLTFLFTHSKSSSSGPDYAKVYAETSAGVFTQVGSRYTLSTSETDVSLALPEALEGKTWASPARLRIHVYGDASSSRNYEMTDLSIQSANAAPVLTVPAGPFSTMEDTSLAIPGISVADADAGTADVRLQITVTNGTVTFGSTSGLSFTSGSNGSSNMTIQATLAEFNAVVPTLSFQGNVQFSGTATIAMTLNDRGNTGTGGNKTDSGSISVQVNPVNDAPVITAPAGPLNANEDANLTITPLSFQDADAGSNPVQLTLSATNGTLSFSSTSGLNFISGSDGSDAMVVQATIATLNARTLRFRGNTEYSGPASVALELNDLGNSGGPAATDSAGFVINIAAVNDEPVNTLPSGPLNTIEDTPLEITGFSVSDADAGSANVRVQLSVTNGVLTLGALPGGVSIVGGSNGSATVTLEGAITDLNSAIASFTYQPTANSTANAVLTMTTNDRGNTGGSAQTDTDSVTINVAAVNDAPVLTAPATESGNEDANIAINGVSIQDVDAGSSSLRVTLTVTNGVARLATTTGINFISGSNNSSSMQFQGTLTRINNALNNFVYDSSSNFYGTATVNILVSDLGNSGSGGTLMDEKTIEVTVNGINDTPTVSLPFFLIAGEDVGTSVSVTASDADSGSSEVLVTVTASNGVVWLASTAGLSFVTGADGSGTMQFTGTISDAAQALDNLSYLPLPDHSGGGSLSVSINDQGHTPGPARSANDSVSVTVISVNDAPVLSLPEGPVLVKEDESLSLSGLSFIDVDADNGDTVEATLACSSGTLTLSSVAGLTMQSGGNGQASMRFTGSKANVLGALSSLSYQGVQNFNGVDGIQVSINDRGNSGFGGQKTTSGSFAVMVTPVNDAPVVNGLAASFSGVEDTALSVGGWSVADLDVLETSGAEMEIDLSVTSGSLNLNTAEVTVISGAPGSAQVSIRGSLEALNNSLASLTFISGENLNGVVTLTVEANDLGNTGEGGDLADVKSALLEIAAVNDSPSLILPEAQITDVNEELSLAVSVGDIDSSETPDAPLEVTLEVTSGGLALATTESLVVTGGGEGATSITVLGLPADLNDALTSVVYYPLEDWEGADELKVSVNDLGATGLGGALTTTGAVELNVTPINDAPLVLVPGVQSVNEDEMLLLPKIHLLDSDATATLGAQLDLALSVTSGIVTIADLGDVTVVDGANGSSGVTVRGTLESLDNVLGSLSYQGGLNVNGADTLSVVVNDLGNTGAGGALWTTETVQLTIVPVNDASEVILPSPVTIRKETDLPLTGILVSDIDAGSLFQVTVSADHGTLRMGSEAGTPSAGSSLAYDAGPAPSVTAVGTLEEINAILQTLIYRSLDGYYGPETITVVADDLGAGGVSGQQTVTQTFPLTIDLPVTMSGFEIE